MRRASFKRKDIQNTLEYLRWMFDDTTSKEAQEVYKEWYFRDE